MTRASDAQREKKITDVTSAQVRAARSLLEWTVRDLSDRAGVHRNTITRIEKAGARGHAVAQLARTLEEAGVVFIPENGDGPGVRLRKEHAVDSVDRPETHVRDRENKLQRQ